MSQDVRSILITGASSGFGRGVAEGLAAAGHHVFATMRGIEGKNAGAASELRAKASEHGWQLHVLELDVTDEASVQAAVDQAMEHAGRIDVLINNAGVGNFGLQEAYSIELVQRLFDVNVFGVLRMNRAVLPHMRAAGSGHVIYVSSGLGRFLIPFTGPYNGTKYALEALAETASYELRGEGVDTTIVQPGAYGTDFSGNMIPADDEARTGSYTVGLQKLEAMGALFASRGEAGEFGDAQEVVDAMVALAQAAPEDRPLRITMGTEGVDEINAAHDELQKMALAWVEFE